MDAATPVSLFDDFSDLKFDYPDLKLFVSIGGWTFSDNDTYTQPIFSNICSSASNRQKFADEALKFLNYYGFDGVDIDWYVIIHFSIVIFLYHHNVSGCRSAGAISADLSKGSILVLQIVEARRKIQTITSS